MLSWKTASKVSFGIQSRLIVLLLIVLIPVMGIQAFNYYDSYQARRAEELKANLEMARAVGKAFYSFVQDVLHDELTIGTVATDPSPLASAALTRLLKTSSTNLPAVSNLHWLSPQGRILASSSSESVGIDASDRDDFQEIASGREWVISDLASAKPDGKLIFTISRAIRDESGRLLGLIVATVVPEMLDSVLSMHRTGDAGVSLIDSKGMHVYRYPAIKYSQEQRNWLKAYPVLGDALKGRDVMAKITSIRTGKQRLTGFTPVASIGWVAAASRTVDDAMEPVTSALLWQAGGFFCVAFSSFVFALWISRGIARPIETIHRHALSLGRGNWDERITVSGPKEAQVLADALNWMAMERQQAEEKLRQLNEQLEHRVEQRTHELQETQKQYLHAEKLSAIGKLSASIAHEFNNPLQGILSILKGLQKRVILEDEDKELLDAAISEGYRIKDLIRSLQDFNRPSSGRKVAMDMHQCLNSLLLLHKNDFKHKKISVILDYAERLPLILAIPDQIKQVFLNLLTNAAEACYQAGGVITVSTRQVDDKVAVAIKDTGMGIKPEEMELIFQPFYTTKSEVKGTGLGLSVSYGIIQHHNGEIRVESQPGAGTTFTVLLPIKGSNDV